MGAVPGLRTETERPGQTLGRPRAPPPEKRAREARQRRERQRHEQVAGGRDEGEMMPSRVSDIGIRPTWIARNTPPSVEHPHEVGRPHRLRRGLRLGAQACERPRSGKPEPRVRMIVAPGRRRALRSSVGAISIRHPAAAI